jgi:hypothetical protein
MPFVAPLLLSILFAQHVCNWIYQASVSGYFVHTYGRYNAVMWLWNLFISWFNPLFLAIAALSFVALLVMRRASQRIDSFCRWRAGPLGLAVIGVGIAAIARDVFPSHVPVSFGELTIPVDLLLALAFKVLAILVVWKALKASGLASSSKDVRKLSWKLLIVLASAIHLILPVRHYLVGLAWLMVPDAIPRGLLPHSQGVVPFVVDSVVALLMARFLLVRGARDRVFVPFPEARAVGIAFWFFVAFLVLAPVGWILSLIPYGGGVIPREVKTLFAVTEAMGIYLLYRGLIRGVA